MGPSDPDFPRKGNPLMIAKIMWAVLLILASSLSRAGEEPCVFVQQNIQWESTPRGYEVGNGTIVALDAHHNFLKMFAQFFRDGRNHALTLDIKSGYLISVGKWNQENAQQISVTLTTVDSYKYFRLQGDNSSTDAKETWQLSGKKLGPLTDHLALGQDQFAPASGLAGIDKVYRFWSSFVPKPDHGE
jgi:hypothetical protein